MKYFHLLGGLLLAATTIAHAQSVTPASSTAAPASTVTTTVDHNPVYSPGKCSFRLNLKGGAFSVNNRAYVKGGVYYSPPSSREWNFSVLCHAGASQDEIDGLLGAKLISGQWIDANFNEPFKPEQHLDVKKIAGKNWAGVAVGHDMIYGPEDRRQRIFMFCLVESHGSQVLCGRGPAVGTTSPATAGKIKKVLDVIKTIEFVDPPTTVSASSSTAAGY